MYKLKNFIEKIDKLKQPLECNEVMSFAIIPRKLVEEEIYRRQAQIEDHFKQTDFCERTQLIE